MWFSTGDPSFLLASPGNGFWNDDLHLRPLERCKIFDQRWIVVPGGDDGNLGGATSHGQLALPAADVIPRAGQSLSATPVTKPAHAANDRLLERRAIVPSRGREMARRALERLPKAE